MKLKPASHQPRIHSHRNRIVLAAIALIALFGLATSFRRRAPVELPLVLFGYTNLAGKPTALLHWYPPNGSRRSEQFFNLLIWRHEGAEVIARMPNGEFRTNLNALEITRFIASGTNFVDEIQVALPETATEFTVIFHSSRSRGWSVGGSEWELPWRTEFLCRSKTITRSALSD